MLKCSFWLQWALTLHAQFLCDIIWKLGDRLGGLENSDSNKTIYNWSKATSQNPMWRSTKQGKRFVKCPEKRTCLPKWNESWRETIPINSAESRRLWRWTGHPSNLCPRLDNTSPRPAFISSHGNFCSCNILPSHAKATNLTKRAKVVHFFMALDWFTCLPWGGYDEPGYFLLERVIIWRSYLLCNQLQVQSNLQYEETLFVQLDIIYCCCFGRSLWLWFRNSWEKH